MARDHESQADASAAAYAAAEASIRAAEHELAAMFGDGAATPSPQAAAARGPQRAATAPLDGAEVGREDGSHHDPPRASIPVAAPGGAPPPVEGGRRLSGRARRRVGGIAITLAFVPVGLVGSAALAGGDGRADPAAAIEAVVAPSPPRQAPSFDPKAVRSRLGKHVSVVARVPAGKVRVRKRPRAASRPRTLRALRMGGRRLPLVLLVKQRRAGWLQVYLPSRPNLSKGWIRRSAVKLRANPYRVKIELSAHRITAWRGATKIVRARIGVGKSLTPTPRGQYYVTDLLRPPNPRGTYGPYAFGLSGHSPVLTSFAGGDGQIGLHGTDQPSALGTDVSHGCIRVRNRVIRKLARTLPLGTPLAIRS